jgi:hypothetical protein
MKKLIFAAILAFLATALFAQTNLIQIDSAVQGLWTVEAQSTDSGATVQETGMTEPLCRVYGTKVDSYDGQSTKFSQITYFKDPKTGIIYNIILLEGRDIAWVVSKPSPPYILLKIMDTSDNNNWKETVRNIIRLSE